MLLFTASWCRYCQPLKHLIQDNDINIEIIDIDENPSLAIEEQILQLPTLVFDDGEHMLESENIMKYLREFYDV